MGFRNKVKGIILIRKYCLNWELILLNIFRKSNSDVNLRTGLNIKQIKDPYSLCILLENRWSILKIDDQFLVIGNPQQIKIKCRLKMGNDLGHLVEIFEFGTYSIDFKNSTIIDVGASNGDSSIYFASKGASKIYALEPMKESFDLAMENIKMNDLSEKIVLINSAINGSGGEQQLYISSRDPNANSLEPTMAIKEEILIQFDLKKNVNVVTISDIIRNYQLPSLTLLKMDCEGCEYPIVLNTDKETLRSFNQIMIECHYGYKNIEMKLKDAGFKVSHSKVHYAYNKFAENPIMYVNLLKAELR